MQNNYNFLLPVSLVIIIIIMMMIIIIIIITIIIIINETDEVLVIPSLEGDHTTSLSKENILKSLYAKTRPVQ